MHRIRSKEHTITEGCAVRNSAQGRGSLELVESSSAPAALGLAVAAAKQF